MISRAITIAATDSIDHSRQMENAPKPIRRATESISQAAIPGRGNSMLLIARQQAALYEGTKTIAIANTLELLETEHRRIAKAFRVGGPLAAAGQRHQLAVSHSGEMWFLSAGTLRVFASGLQHLVAESPESTDYRLSEHYALEGFTAASSRTTIYNPAGSIMFISPSNESQLLRLVQLPHEN